MDQRTLKAEYERQQTHEGQSALMMKRNLAEQFSKVLNKPMKIGVVQPLINAQTGKTTKYFIVE